MFKENIHATVWAYRHISGKLRVPEIDLISKYLSPDSICFDVGAHGGSWSQGLACALPRAHIYAFEALPYYFDVLQKTMKLLRQKRITVLNNAVGENDDLEVQMVRRDSQGTKLTGATHISASGEVGQEMSVVLTTTLDSFWQKLGKKKIDFIKCDVEGFELFVLKGAKNLIEQCRPIFFNELNAEWCNRYGYTPREIFSFFEEKKYLPFYIDLQAGLIKVDATKHINRDVLFLPQERLR